MISENEEGVPIDKSPPSPPYSLHAMIPMIHDTQQPEIDGGLKLQGEEESSVRALLDSGAKGTYIQAGSPLLKNATINRYSHPKTVRMLDGHATQSKVTQFVYATFKPHHSYEPIHLKLDLLSFIGPDLLLGDDFLDINKVILNYKAKTVNFNCLRPIASGVDLIPLRKKRSWGSPTVIVRGVAKEYEDIEVEDSKLREQVPVGLPRTPQSVQSESC